ncbi:DUF6146 family protein [Flavobacterium sp. HXWNR69]|uniref:DUF6146 family protein n=1 Tax=Flavobacterium fragile TaxID=2949085 RepID=A0ABT0TJ18_9FLAO|nr:DUF6146 family protein [Flavobacterium sp. HXWNR69]MCL9770877.1 DUF6146 family protein [Flavobacterium sp. HXWNR69]
MKQIVLLLFVGFSALTACTSMHNENKFKDKPKLESDTIRIANDKIEYEILIIDSGFTSWFNSFAKPRNYYSQSFLESRNRVWVTEWNRRATLSFQYDPNLYGMTIDYQQNVDYGYEVNYMLYNYLVYFQLTHNQKLGGFTPRI